MFVPSTKRQNSADVALKKNRTKDSMYVQYMSNCLLCLNQAREFGTIVDDFPIPLDHKGQSTFSLHTADRTVFPFSRYGPTSYIHVVGFKVIRWELMLLIAT